MITTVTDWPARCASRIYAQYVGTTLPTVVASSVGAKANNLELAYEAIRSLWSIDPVTDDLASPSYGVGRGVQLDRIGVLVGEPRGAADDATYRPILRAKIVVNKSNGGPVSIIDVFLAMFSGSGAPLLTPGWIAQFTLRLVGVLMPPLVLPAALQLLGAATQGGTRAVLEYTSSAPALVFTFNSRTAGQGWGDTGNGLVGGLMGGAAEAP